MKNWTLDPGHLHGLQRAQPRHLHPDALPFREPGQLTSGSTARAFSAGWARRSACRSIDAGHSAKFDDEFIVQGNSQRKVRVLLANPEVRRLIEAQPQIRLEIRDDEGFFKTRFPEGVDELHFLALGTIKDVDRLKMMFDLFAAVLEELNRVGSATKSGPRGRAVSQRTD